jgi:group II intron reverse transcriptase/maturase
MGLKFVVLTQGDLPGSDGNVGRPEDLNQERRTMTRQKSDDRVVPKGFRKAAPTWATGGGKAVTVDEVARQPGLPFATAEAAQRCDAGVKSRADRSAQKPTPRPKASDKEGTAAPATIEAVAERLYEAFTKVASNKGAAGPDGRSIEEVERHLDTIVLAVRSELLAGTYRPGDVRRVFIPKSGGGERGLGIPNVVDRMVQEAVRQVLEPLYEPTFHPSSHGFRPNRGCHTAITEARKHLSEGYEWVVDLDLEKFFDRVHHQRLMARLAERVHDKRLLKLIGWMLKTQVVMPNGVKVSTEEGVPQGGPLSPLLSNIVLDELDRELSQRGHRFVRYADDANIYVRSERSGKRVMESVTRFIQKRLRLKVNADKSAVARPGTRHFLGYRLRPGEDGGTEVLLSERSVKRLRERVRELTPRNRGVSLGAMIEKINVYLTGWFGHFGICTRGMERTIQGVDGHLRRRLRAFQLKQWKSKRTIARRLIRHGVKPKTAWRRVYEGRKGLHALSQMLVVNKALPNAFFAERGLVTLLDRFAKPWAALVAPTQQALPWG